MLTTNRQNRLPYLFMLPAIILIVTVYAIPFVYSIIISLTDWNGISKNFNFIGFDNYIKAFNETTFLAVLKNTFQYFIVIVVVQNIVALFMAVLIFGNFKGNDFFRTTLFLPTIVATVAVGFIWNLLLNPFGGPIPIILEKFNSPLKDIIWLGDVKKVINVISVINVWQWAGWSMLIYYSGLQGIDNSLYESANIDGAGMITKFFKITIPMLAPSITINIVNASIGSFKIFDLPFILTGGGPGHASESLSISIYTNSFLLNRMGYGTALSLMLFIFVLLIAIFQTLYLRRREESIK